MIPDPDIQAVREFIQSLLPLSEERAPAALHALERIEGRIIPELPDDLWLTLLPLTGGSWLATLHYEGSDGQELEASEAEGPTIASAVRAAVEKIGEGK